MATVDFSQIPGTALGKLEEAALGESVFVKAGVPVITAPVKNGSFWISIDSFEARDHNSSDADAKVIDTLTFTKTEIELTTFYHVVEFDDIEFDAYSDIVADYLGKVPEALARKLNTYVFTGKTSGTPTSWTGFTGDSVELVDDTSLMEAVDTLASRGYDNGNIIVLDNSVRSLVRSALKGDGLGSLTSISLDGNLSIAGIPTYFTNIGTSIVSNEKTVGVALSVNSFRIARGGAKITTSDKNDGLDDIIVLKTRQFAGFAGIQNAAIRFKVSVTS